VADDKTKLEFQAEVQDRTKPGLDKVKQSVTKASATMNRSPIIGDKQQQAMRAFNEKTEKGRQMLTAFGGVMGGAAGQAVYYGGTLSYILAMFKPWEAALMAVIAAVAGLVYWINQETEAEKAWRKEREEAEKLSKKMADRLQNYWDQIKNVSAREKDMIEIRKKLNPLEQRYSELIRRKAFWQERFDALTAKGSSVADKAAKLLSATNQELLQVVATMNPLQQLLKGIQVADAVLEKQAKDKAKAAEARQKKEAARQKEIARKAQVARQMELYEQKLIDDALADEFSLLAEEDEYYKEKRIQDQQDLVEELRKELEAERQAIKEHNDYLQELRRENQQNIDRATTNEIQRQEQEKKDAIALEKQALQDRMDYAAMGADAIVGLAQTLATGNAKAIAETLKAMAIEAMARAAWHGIMALASGMLGNAGGASRHGILAGLYAGFAATYGAGAGLASASAGGGGGGSSGIGGTATPGYGGMDRNERSGQTESGKDVVINVWGSQFFGGDAGREITNWVDTYRNGQEPGRARSRF